MATLGCAASYSVLLVEEIFNMNPLTGKASYGRPVGPLDDFSQLVWDRRLDDISEAEITIPTNADCCAAFLADAHVVHHGIAIFRDGEMVWNGPITRIRRSRTQIVIKASDVMWILRKRLLPRDICFSADTAAVCGGVGFTGLGFGGPRNTEFVAATLIREGLTYDDHGAFVEVLSESDNLFEASYYQTGGPVWDLVQTLASDFINYTVLGRKIIITDGTLGRTAMLMCEDFVNDTFETIEDGDGLLTVDCQVSDPLPTDPNGPPQETGCVSVHPGLFADPYYGLLEGVQDGNRALAVGSTTLSPQTILELAARNVLDGSYPPPVALSADGLQLSPNAPIAISELVPGTVVPIIANCLCGQIGREYILAKVVVTFDVNGERVEPTFIAAGQDNPGDFTEF
jgi:hypothetical protein